jgi:hypothetical protein
MHKKGTIKNRQEEQHINKDERYKQRPRIADSVGGTWINHVVVIVVIAE